MASATARKYRELREARGLSPTEVGHRLAVDDAIVTGWENDESHPAPEHLPSLAALYGVSQDELRHLQNAAHHPTGN